MYNESGRDLKQPASFPCRSWNTDAEGRWPTQTIVSKSHYLTSQGRAEAFCKLLFQQRHISDSSRFILLRPSKAWEWCHPSWSTALSIKPSAGPLKVCQIDRILNSSSVHLVCAEQENWYVYSGHPQEYGGTQQTGSLKSVTWFFFFCSPEALRAGIINSQFFRSPERLLTVALFVSSASLHIGVTGRTN